MNLTYLMELHFLKTTIPLLFIIHVEYLNQFHSHYLFIFHTLCFEHIREFTLTYYKLLNQSYCYLPINF